MALVAGSDCCLTAQDAAMSLSKKVPVKIIVDVHERRSGRRSRVGVPSLARRKDLQIGRCETIFKTALAVHGAREFESRPRRYVVDG